MATSYSSQAAVVAGDEEFSVEADLFIRQEPGGMKSWDGSLRSDPSVDLWDAEDPVLLVPDDREGKIIMIGGPAGSGELEVQGSGPAPF
ncbi:hypothetical protein JS756_29590 [Streptomyces actuosus]|uniref:Uncharacterized protein n=1 Tax=Streptomyces actuosus TaxID=1885 RepID=A0ABS2VYG5_STRAS|nr:hypothetical protein [Streptomyces actuosus]MBN0048190.1 hypothetical protein [Streptomyces actuosus]